jgi:nucleotide-binding universal stress UspA family protein
LPLQSVVRAERQSRLEVPTMFTSHGPRPVAAGVDGSTSSIRAVQWAARQAALWGVPLRLVHAHVWPLIHQPSLAGLTGHDLQALLNLGYNWLRRAADAATGAVPDIDVNTELVTSAAAPLLIHESADARLVVVGSRGLGGFTGLLVGSNAVALSAHARSPVAVIRTPGDDAEPPRSGPVVLGVNGSPTNDEAAIAFAYEAAAQRQVPLTAVHAWTDVTSQPSFLPPLDHNWPVIADDERRLLAERLAGWQQKYPDVQVEHVVTEGRPADSLLQAAQGAQLVVVGTRGRGGLRGLFLGSTCHALLHHAACPVIVARPEADAP